MTAPLAARIANLGLAGLACLPFVISKHTLPITTFYVEWVAGLTGLIVLLALFARPAQPLEIPRIIWFPLGLAALVLLQALLGQVNYPSQAVLAALYLLWAMLLLLASRRLTQVLGLEHVVDSLAWALLAGGLFNAFVAALQFSGAANGLPFIVHPPRAVIYGNLAQANHFADYQALALASAMYLHVNGRLRPPIALPVGLLLLAGLAMSGSRSAWLYLLSCAALAFWLFRQRKEPDSRRLLLISLAALPAFFMIQQGLDALGLMTANRRLAGFGDFIIRLSLWRDAWTTFLNAPWFGVGYQQYGWHHFLLILGGGSPFTSLAGFEDVVAEHSHNIVLQLLAEFGIAAVPLLAWAAWRLIVGVRAIDTIHRWWLMALLGVLAIHSLLEYPLWYANFLGVAAVLFALADNRPYRFVIPLASLRRLSAAFLLIGGSILAATWFGYTALERMMLAWSTARTPETVALIQNNLRPAQLATFLEPQLDALLANLPVDSQEQEAVTTRAALSAKVLRQMTNATTVYRHVAWLWMAGQTAESLALLDQALRAYPASRERNEAELLRMARLYPEIEPLLWAARSTQASAAPLPASAATPAGAGMFRPPDYPATP